MGFRIAAVVVTFNRKNLLIQCVSSLFSQTRRPDKIFIIDNNSEDGTCELFSPHGLLNTENIEYVRLNENIGGSGGFYVGMKEAHLQGFDWVWLMDDDADPYHDALECLEKNTRSKGTNYGSIAVCGNHLSWGVGDFRRKNVAYELWDELPDVVETWMLPFIGFLVSEFTMDKVGYVDPHYFIAADDVEYCYRCRKHGISTMAIKKSKIKHPRAVSVAVNVLNKKIGCLDLNPIKRYYDTRNRILLARKYFGFRCISETLPASLVRLYLSLIRSNDKKEQLRAFWMGTIDGLFGLKGRRHDHWRLGT